MERTQIAGVKHGPRDVADDIGTTSPTGDKLLGLAQVASNQVPRPALSWSISWRMKSMTLSSLTQALCFQRYSTDFERS